MPTTVPTVERDWNRIEAGHQAIDQLNQIVGELRGTLDHDPHAAGRLRTALAILLGDQVTVLTTDEQVDIIAALESSAEDHEGRNGDARDEMAYYNRRNDPETAAIHEADAVREQDTADRLRALAERIEQAARVAVTR